LVVTAPDSLQPTLKIPEAVTGISPDPQPKPMTAITPAFELQVAEYRDYLLRFARLQLRNDAWAEDCVSETMLAALAKPQAFGNRSQLKTWLVGILKHKVLDTLRSRAREAVLDGENGDGSEELDALTFKADGHFASAPSEWGNPEQNLGSRQFIAVLETCLEKLPGTLGRIFLMREWLELTTDEICKETGITSTNLFVQLHRARLRLRECLEINWLQQA
jgi:RNA polymerase sigma-70 factor (TIGR02943 family)